MERGTTKMNTGIFKEHYKIWIGMSVFAVIVTSLLIYQQYRKQEFIHYLQQVEECFKSVDSLQELSLKVNQAGIAGDEMQALELTQTMIQRSEEFLAPFKEIAVHSDALKKMHDKLLDLNQKTHDLLIVRSDSMSQMQDKSMTPEMKQKKIEEFWALEDSNKTLYRSLNDELQKYGKRVGVDPAKYLKHF